MQLHLTLANKGFILISVPLVFELTFVAILSHLLNQAEYERWREANSKAIILETEKLNKSCNDAMTALAFYGLAGSPVYAERYSQATREISEQIRTLKELVRNDRGAFEAIKIREATATGVLTALNDYKNSLRSEGTRASLVLNAGTLHGLTSLITKMTGQVNRLGLEARQVAIAAPKEQAKWRRLVQHCLLIGVVLNVVLAVLLAIYFNRSTARRHAVLMDNTLRLAKGQPLNPLLAGNDEIARLDHVFHDMSKALAQATELLKANEARLRSILENMPVGLVIANEDGIIQMVNPETERIFGYRQDELECKPLSLLFSGNDTSDDILNKLKEKALNRAFPWQALKKGGEAFPVQLSLTEFAGLDGRQLLAGILDISEQHRIERFKRDFVATVSHELRTPLTAISITLALFKKGVVGQLSEKARHHIDVADRNARRLVGIINDLLDVERLEAGKAKLSFEPISLGTIIQRSFESVTPIASEKAITLENKAVDCSIFADGDRIVQVLVNLLSNAIKFSRPDSAIVVEAELAPYFVEIRVTDSGRGIPAEYREAIFEKFQQVDRADGNQKGGSGLGLPICKAIVEQHGGSIGVLSELGKGSTFWFRLPRGDHDNTKMPIEGPLERAC